MAPDEPVAARAEFARLRALVDMRLAELRAALDDHEAVRPLHWRHVGDLEHVEESLNDLIVFLKRG